MPRFVINDELLEHFNIIWQYAFSILATQEGSMGILKSGVRVVTSPFRKWMGTESLGRDARNIRGIANSIIKTPQPHQVKKESFEQAIKRQNLTEADIQRRIKETKITSWVYFSFFVGLLIYTFVLIFNLNYLGILMSAVMTILAGVLAMRESFWYMQMKQRKLGITLSQWFRFITWRK